KKIKEKKKMKQMSKPKNHETSPPELPGGDPSVPLTGPLPAPPPPPIASPTPPTPTTIPANPPSSLLADDASPPLRPTPTPTPACGPTAHDVGDPAADVAADDGGRLPPEGDAGAGTG